MSTIKSLLVRWIISFTTIFVFLVGGGKIWTWHARVVVHGLSPTLVLMTLLLTLIFVFRAHKQRHEAGVTWLLSPFLLTPPLVVLGWFFQELLSRGLHTSRGAAIGALLAFALGLRGLAEISLASTLVGAYLVTDPSIFRWLAISSVVGDALGCFLLTLLVALLHERAKAAFKRGNMKRGLRLAQVTGWFSWVVRPDVREGLIAYVGSAQVMTGRPERAIKPYRKALQLARLSGDRIREVGNLHDIAAATMASGRVKEGLLTLEESLILLGGHEAFKKLDQASKVVSHVRPSTPAEQGPDYRQDSRAVLRADLMSKLSSAHRRLNHLQQALFYGENALAIFERSGIQSRQAETLNNLSFIYSLLNHDDRAIELTQRALLLYALTGEKSKEALQHVHLGAYLVRQGALGPETERERKFAESEKHYKAAVAILDQGERDPRMRRFAVGNLANLARLRGEFTQALDGYQKALTISQQNSDESGEVIARLGIGMALGQLGQKTEAQQAMEKSLVLAQRLGDQGILRVVLFQLGQLYEAGGSPLELDAAYEHYRQSIDLLEGARASLVDIDARVDFLGVEIRVDVYRHMVTLCVRRQKKTEAFDYTERSKARALLELLARVSDADTHVEPIEFTCMKEVLHKSQ